MSIPEDLTLPAALNEVDSYFLINSYVKGYTYSDEDKALYDKLDSKIDSNVHMNAARWSKHIKSIHECDKLKEIYSVKDEETPKNDDDEIDLFGDDDDDEIEKLREQRAKEAAEKKKKNGGLVAKSLVVLDVKPWDDTTDLEEIKKKVLSIQMDGLIWGTSKLEPLSYGIMKLRIACAIEDEKVSVDDLSSQIEEFSDLVQSVDIASFNKI